MRIRFLQVVDSENAGYPFQPGQVLTTDHPSPYLLSLIDNRRAELVRNDETERAVVESGEQPEPKSRAKRDRH